ncbi:hypothetical protein JYU34_017102 [Plutella xylostella]|uniref:HOOK N-terminal domain-containing protein n=1 Tax=Plutella xylostella TaxID=51655 RepID=A0ABQ7Q1S8_PLUXY|nr:hypothetical protein JYU34_017102 [Plutella xylostella]
MAVSASDIEDFMSGPLVSWLKSCHPNPQCITEYSSLFDGDIIHQAYLQIDPEPSFHITKLDGLEDQALLLGRVKNFDAIVKNVQALYEEELGMTLLVVPECVSLGRAPESHAGLEHMRLLLLLLLGAAVHCPNKELFITRIKELDVDLQHAIVECIKQVTDTQTVALPAEAAESPAVFQHMRRLARERDLYLRRWAALVAGGDAGDAGGAGRDAPPAPDSQHLAVELADWKARLRKQRQELEEKSEQLAECRSELAHAAAQATRLRADAAAWQAEARRAAALRDELDAQRERADRADRLEQEIEKYRSRLSDAEYYKCLVGELRDDNRALLEAREQLEEQLAGAGRRAAAAAALQAALLQARRDAADRQLERDAAQQKLQELMEENNQLQYVTKCMLSESQGGADPDEGGATPEAADTSLSEQLSSRRALRLELECRRLRAALARLQDEPPPPDQVVELETENKKLKLKCDQLDSSCERLRAQAAELDQVFKNALDENAKLQDALDAKQAVIDKQAVDREAEKNKLQDFEKHLEALTKDKQRIQMLCDSIQRRADELEKTLDARSKELAAARPDADRLPPLLIELEELKTKLTYSEKETHNLQREVYKLREAVEEKDVSLDKVTTEIELKRREIERLTKEIESANNMVCKLQDFEQKAKELKSQKKMDSETIQTLQKDLIAEKVNFDKVRNCIEKLGINVTELATRDLGVEELLERILGNSEHEAIIAHLAAAPCDCTGKEQPTESTAPDPHVEQLTAELTAAQAALAAAQGEVAARQVAAATAAARAGSLAAQQHTLQLANSQLAAEKEELAARLSALAAAHGAAQRDTAALQRLHEALAAQYEALAAEREPLRAAARDLRAEIRDLKDSLAASEKKVADLEAEKENVKVEARNLTNLRAEHSKLKDDFRNLFTASDRLKSEYRGMQEQWRAARDEAAAARGAAAAARGEAATARAAAAAARGEGELLRDVNAALEGDRRALMEHAAALLAQYHELLAHALADQQHYHREERLFADRLHALCRQKEKLEEKIMEHYRRLDSSPGKRRGFGAALVQRVRRAGSELIRAGRGARAGTGGDAAPGSGSDSDHTARSDPAQDPAELSGSVSAPSLDSLEPPARRLSASSVPGAGGGGGAALLRASLRRPAPPAHRASYQGPPADDPLTPPVSTPSPVFGSAGSRRTVYVADPAPAPPAPPAAPPAPPAAAPAPAAASTPLKDAPTYLVYNRISTVIGAPDASPDQSPDPSPDAPAPPADRTDNSKESAIWYEYGCV